MRLILAGLVWLACASVATAHEVRPAIADLEAGAGSVTLSITMNAETFLAGVNLEGVDDTDATEDSDRVDALRALTPDAIAQAFEAEAERLIQGIAFEADGEALPLGFRAVEPGPVGDIDLPRDTVVTLGAALPEGTRTVSMGWPAELGTLILRQQGPENGYTGYLAGERSGPIEIAGGDAKSGFGVFAEYIPVGFDHIVPKGLDHILFVLGLFFLSSRLGTLIWQVSAFTLAHTVTLALGALGYVSVPAAIVEPIIAASIVYVAVENILSDKLHRWRPVVIFVFGLLHGLGFASVLGEFGLPEGQFVPALLGFNLGVEFGQLTVIAIAFAIVWMAQRADAGLVDARSGQIAYGTSALVFLGLGWALSVPAFEAAVGISAGAAFVPLAVLCFCCALAVINADDGPAYRRFVAVPASAAIACVGAIWFIQRVFFWS
ncbi:HupE/UreJ family protein [Cognatishimia sp. F0-27]|uniref:HupE/UreJ family protein n=1 Tax=Cognatishimia sp. F0-27 TaxID=2816855 RepID=UPI001D0C45E7|nr:HupE/UreJ family protein [Cognatishimia sp. F0-27]MCC1492648.1 HupE/UreJ family protein [Cognatishimia sp. F0-27]